MPNIFINILHLHYLEGKDGEGEDDDGGDAGRNDHSVRVILHAHLFASHEGNMVGDLKWEKSIITMPRMIPSVIVNVANRMKLIGKLLKRIG